MKQRQLSTNAGIGRFNAPLWALNSGVTEGCRASLRQQRIVGMYNRWTVCSKKMPRWAEIRVKHLSSLYQNINRLY